MPRESEGHCGTDLALIVDVDAAGLLDADEETVHQVHQEEDVGSHVELEHVAGVARVAAAPKGQFDGHNKDRQDENQDAKGLEELVEWGLWVH